MSRILEDDMVFDFTTFNNLYTEKRQKSKCKIGQYDNELAEAIHVSPESLKNYRKGSNGPGDIGIVKAIADCWNIDYRILLKGKTQEEMSNMNDRQREAVRRIFCSILAFMDIMIETDGTFCEKNGEFLVDKTDRYDYADSEYQKVLSAVKKEYIDLGKHPLYDILMDFVYDDLDEMYCRHDKMNKCDPAYRYEPEGKSAQDDYDETFAKLTKLLDQYI